MLAWWSSVLEGDSNEEEGAVGTEVVVLGALDVEDADVDARVKGGSDDDDIVSETTPGPARKKSRQVSDRLQASTRCHRRSLLSAVKPPIVQR